MGLHSQISLQGINIFKRESMIIRLFEQSFHAQETQL